MSKNLQLPEKHGINGEVLLAENGLDVRLEERIAE
jgi:hypothetical protein